MALFLEEHKKFLLLLAHHEVNFLLIGGYAVIYYGYERTTNDMDIWLKPTKANRDRFIDTLKTHGVAEEKLDALKKMDFTKPHVLSIGQKPNQIEFLTVVSGLNFEDADNNKSLLEVGKQQVGLLGFEDLVSNKMITGRPQDKADVDILQKVQEARDND